MSWLIYKHTNKVNGKVYIGQTKVSPKGRWRNGLGYLRNENDTIFSRAIKKYGWKNFDHEIVEEGLSTQDQANEREQHWIKVFKSYVGFEDSNGYNMTLGGDSGEHLGYSVYQIDKATMEIVREFPSISEASRYFGKGEGNASQIRRCCEGEKPTSKGFYWCYVKDYSPSWKPKDNALVSPVYQIDDDMEIVRRFESITKAAEHGYSRGTIVQCCKGKCAKANGFYWCYEREFGPDWKPASVSFVKNARVYCFETAKAYRNAKEASLDTGANHGKILRCCRGLENGANGLHFCYLKDKENYSLKETSKRAPKFSSEELEILKEKYPLLGAGVSVYLPNRTKHAIAQEVHRLKLKYVGENKHNKKVLCVELNKTFDSINEAYIFLGLKDGSSIGRCCSGQRKTAGGYHWQYIEE